MPFMVSRFLYSLLLLFIKISTTSANAAGGANDFVIAKTNFGTVEGFIHPLENGKFMNVFLGVPYAQPPIGELRFEKPLPPQKWEGIRQAKDHPPACVPHAPPSELEPIWSAVEDISEDCLHLNVFVPSRQNGTTAGKGLVPILFVIHGGGFEVGSSRVYDYKEMGERFVSRGIMVVTVQYRLGVLGFASTGDKVMPGNLGLWDLVQALRWLRSEAADAFGGDARRLTAIGYSAGGAAISALGMSPYGRSLFHQAIQMSGSMLAPTKSGTFVANDTIELAKVLKCPNADSLALRECLRTKSVKEIHAGVLEIGPSRLDVNFAKFASREDGHFFPRDLVELIHESPPIRTLMGHCRLDSLAYTLLQSNNDSVTQYAVARQHIEHFGQSDFEQFVRQMVAKEEYFGPTKAPKVQAQIIDYFTRQFKVPSKRDSQFYLERYSMVLSDLQYVMPALWESRLKVNWDWPIFLYEFVWAEPALFPEWVKVHEAFHGLDHSLLFGDGTHLPLGSAEARKVGQMLVEAVANFVLHGNPSTREALWVPATTAEPMRHLQIDGPKPKMKQMMNDFERLKFWHRLTEEHSEFNLIKGTFGKKPTGHEEL